MRQIEARFIGVKQIRDIKEQIEELKQQRVWAEVIENEKVNSMHYIFSLWYVRLVVCLVLGTKYWIIRCVDCKITLSIGLINIHIEAFVFSRPLLCQAKPTDQD